MLSIATATWSTPTSCCWLDDGDSAWPPAPPRSRWRPCLDRLARDFALAGCRLHCLAALPRWPSPPPWSPSECRPESFAPGWSPAGIARPGSSLPAPPRRIPCPCCPLWLPHGGIDSQQVRLRGEVLHRGHDLPIAWLCSESRIMLAAIASICWRMRFIPAPTSSVDLRPFCELCAAFCALSDPPWPSGSRPAPFAGLLPPWWWSQLTAAADSLALVASWLWKRRFRWPWSLANWPLR